MAHAPLSLFEREEIGAALIADRAASWVSIGRRVGRPAATISREVCRNGGRHSYRPAIAQAHDHIMSPAAFVVTASLVLLATPQRLRLDGGGSGRGDGPGGCRLMPGHGDAPEGSDG